jgi:hypothetical protein
MTDQILNNEKLTYILLYIFIVIYGKIYTPKIPPFIKKIITSEIGLLAIISFIAYMSNNNIRTSVILSLVLIITMDLLKQEEINESFINLDNFSEFYF